MAWSTGCIFGQSFASPQAFTNHRHSCLKLKKQLSFTLEQANAVQEAKKLHKTEASLVPPELLALPTMRLYLAPTSRLVITSWGLLCQTAKTSMDHKDLNQSLAECRQCCKHRQLLKQYQDVAPECPATSSFSFAGHVSLYMNRAKCASISISVPISARPTTCASGQKDPQILTQYIWAFPAILHDSLSRS